MKRLNLICLIILISLSLTGCFNYAKSPFYDSEWVMQNYDDQANLYYHHLILKPDHTVMLRVSYADSTNIIVWNGTYKLNSKKFDFDFTECLRYENGEVVGKYTSGQMIKYYTGDFYYSVGLLEEGDGKENYHLELIRPKNYFYGENVDVFGNYLQEFVKFK